MKRLYALCLALALLAFPCARAEAQPEILALMAEETLTQPWLAAVTVSCDGTLYLSADGTAAAAFPVEAGDNLISWDGTAEGAPLAAGDHTLYFRLEDGAGNASVTEVMDLYVQAPRGAHDLYPMTPNQQCGTACAHEDCYWNLEMGTADEAAVWAVLMQPVTVLDGNQRHQTKIRREPDSTCRDYTGEVTEESQGVHVLRQEGDWTEIQAYSSSVEGSSVAVWARPFTGWVETAKLKRKEPDPHTGIVIDKLQQRLYVYRDGHLWSTLQCSTGFPTDKTPFNETPSGEFLMISKTGGFWAESGLYCDMAMRINDGILMHEVPCQLVDREDGTRKKDFHRAEPVLGEKASHGCIRIQQLRTPEGVNMQWLWDNLNLLTKVIIWDEVGRELTQADDALPLYYGRTYYHSGPTCYSATEDNWPLPAFTYGQLDGEPYSRLTRCPYCAAPLRPEEIRVMNDKNTRSY